MLVKRSVILLVIVFGVALMLGILGVAFERLSDEDSELRHAAGGVTLVPDPAEVKLGSEHQIRFSVRVSNSGSAPVRAWALDLGKGLYLVRAQPQEVLYHKGHAKGQHGNVLIYATPIEPGDSLEIELTLRVLFDSQGSYDSGPVLKLSYARSARDAQTLALTDLQKFKDTFVTFPFAEAGIHIEQ